MKYPYALLVAGLFSMAASAQPTLTNSDKPAVGDSWSLEPMNGATTPALGGNMTWNYAGLVPGGQALAMEFAAPGTDAPAGTTIMDIGESGNGVVAHYRAGTDGFYQIGFAGTGYGLQCTDDMLMFAYPFTMGSTRTDNFQCDGELIGFNYERTGTIQLSAVGHGTLIMPYGTVNNVLLVKYEQGSTSVYPSFPGQTETFTAVQYQFLKPGVHFYVLMVGTTTLDTGTGPVTTGESWMTVAGGVGIAEAMAQAIGMELVPNPATSTVELLCGALAPGQAILELVDMQGRTVQRVNMQDRTGGIQREMLDVGHLAPGLYTVRVTDAQGATGAKRLVVQ